MVTQKSSRAVGVGRVLIAVYAVLALAATGRSVFQILEQFDEAPLAYTLSALAAVVYIVATVSLIRRGRTSYAVAWATISFELAGVLIVGLVTALDPALFPDDTVWSWFGRGYGFVPLLLPVLGIVWLLRTRPAVEADAADRSE
jgi:cytochrome bd-type quinol oxidase subunit 2